MKKTLVIFARECRVRLSKPSFWVLTFSIPLLLAVLYALPVLAAKKAAHAAEVAVVDETGLFAHRLRSNEVVHFLKVDDVDKAQNLPHTDAILLIPLRETTLPHDAFLFHKAQVPSLALQSAIDAQLQQIMQRTILEDVYGIEQVRVHSIESAHVFLHVREAESGRDSHLQVRQALSLVLALLVVFATLVVMIQTMRSIQDEGQNKVSEIMATSVRPWQLLCGKVCGILVSWIIQLLLWIIFTAAAVALIRHLNSDLFSIATSAEKLPELSSRVVTNEVNRSTFEDQALAGLAELRFATIAVVFFITFISSCLFYGGFAAVLAARLQSDADSLQWSLLLLSPLLVVLSLSSLLIDNPSGALSRWLTLFPPTAPASIMLRLPFGLPTWQMLGAVIFTLIASLLALILAARALHRSTE